jgi:pantoate--beta-alanine ligase
MSDSRPKLVHTVAELRHALDAVRADGRSIGFVPTMGALHEGHLSLVRESKKRCDYTVVSIFVNPSQFAPGEDLGGYPRTLESDLDALAKCEAELVFAPSDSDMYGPEHATWVEVGTVAEPLEGRSRPQHFRGVATIVLKLLNMAGADVAFFGQKDYQQAMVIRRMVEDLDVPTEIRVCPIVREPDGLAMSSRNAYLSPQARRQSLVLWKSLQLARQLVEQRERSAEVIVRRMRAVIATAEDASIDYVALVDPGSLQPVDEVSSATLAALAVNIDNTRLIDNCILEP